MASSPKIQYFIVWIVILTFGLTAKVFAQEPFVRQITTSNNLEDEQINCLLQDHSGYIWVGTSGGVYKFDGLDFSKAADPNGLLTMGVSAIAEDSENNLWFGAENGNMIRYTGKKILEAVTADSLPKRRITAIIEGNNHRIWFGTYGNGIYYTDDMRLVKMGNGPHLTDDFIYSFEKDNEGRIWVGTDDGINMLDVDETKFEITHLTVEDGLPDFIIQYIEKDRYDNMWIGMHEYGVCRYDALTGKIEIPPGLTDWQFGPVNSILALNDRLWITTNGQGLFEYKFDSDRIIRHNEINQVNLSRIKSIMQDFEGNVWLANNNEISLSFGNRLEFIKEVNGLPVQNIHTLIAGKTDYVWYANDQGLFRLKMSDPSVTKRYNIGLNLDRQKIMSLYEDPFGFIWIGTFGQGLVRLDPVSGKFINISEKNGLVNGNILSIKGNDKEIWFATLGGASRVKITGKMRQLRFVPEFENFGKKEGLSNNFIYAIHIDDLNRVWFATDGSGVIYYENGSFTNLKSDSLFRNKVVYSVTTDKVNNVWMNVAHEGLYKYDGHQTRLYFTDPEHSKLSFSGILANRNNELVIAYDEGIDVLQILKGEVIHYEGNAGLDNISPDLNTLSMDGAGNVWAGTSKFIVKYKEREQKYWLRPVTRIDHVSVFLERIDPENDTIFRFNENHFSFDYSGLWFQYPEKVIFNIKLEGHDLDWMTTKNNSMIYSNLSPGAYTFRVRSGLYQNFKDASEASYAFVVEKPYWQTFWFYAMIVIVLILLVLTVIRIRERNLSKKQEVIREKIKFQFENLKSQINPHFLFNSFSTLMALIETDPDEAINYVEELSTLFRNVLEFKDKDVISLKEEFTIIDNYIKLQRKRYGKNLEIQIEHPETAHKLYLPPLTLQLLIENAIKHNVVSKDRPLKIRISTDLTKGYIFVSNSLQLKKEVMASTGIGIENIINRYKILTNKDIRIDKTDESFTIGVPVIFEK